MYRYFAYDCDSVFPNIPKEPPRNLTEVVCDQRYSSVPPSANGEVCSSKLFYYFICLIWKWRRLIMLWILLYMFYDFVSIELFILFCAQVRLNITFCFIIILNLNNFFFLKKPQLGEAYETNWMIINNSH